MEKDLDAPLQEVIEFEGFGHLQEDILATLAARVARQKRMMTRLALDYHMIGRTKESAAALFTLMGKSETGYIASLYFEPETLDEEGWSTLARVLSSVECFSIYCSKEGMKKARREDLRKVLQHQEAAGNWLKDGLPQSCRHFMTFKALTEYLDE